MRRGAIVVVLAMARLAAAETIDLPKTTAKLVLPDDWQSVRAAGVVAAAKSKTGGVLAVTRADVPNPDAWVADKKQAYVDQIERGIKATIPGYKRTARKLVDAAGIPALDLEARRDGGALVVVRVLLYRTYALSLAIELPKGGALKAARAITAAFAPPKDEKAVKAP